MGHEETFYIKPPLGLVPRSVIVANRIKEIMAAMHRYSKVLKPIPVEWLTEYNDLAEWFSKN